MTSAKAHTELHLHPHARWNLIFAYVSLFYFGLCDNLRGPVYPEILRAFGLSNSVGTWFFALASGTSVLAGLSVPFMLRRWRYLTTFRFSLACLVLAQFIDAVAPSFGVLLFGSFAMGISISGLGVLQNVLVLVAAPPRALPRLLSGLHANYAGSSLLAPLLVAQLFGWFDGFQAVFWASGVLGLLLLAATWMFPGFVEAVDQPDTRPRRSIQWPDGSILAFAVILASYTLAEIVVGTRLAQYAREILGEDRTAASYWTAAFFVGLFVSRLAWTFISFPWSARRQLAIGLLTSAAFAVAGLIVSPWFFPFVGLAMGPCYPLAMAFLRERFPHRLEEATTAGIVAIGVFVVSMHLGVGPLSDVWGLRWAMSLAPVFCLLGTGLLIWDSQKRGGHGG